MCRSGADQFFNAGAAEAAGAARVSSLDAVDAAAIASVLSDASLRAGAERVAAELAALPTPDEVLPSVLLETVAEGALR